MEIEEYRMIVNSVVLTTSEAWFWQKWSVEKKAFEVGLWAKGSD